ncbi:MAG: type IX secretion system protein PorQ [Schleiferiaceae bacterium]|nr:type IX secretion system protein PorQ [Schleiferiaceae bacterium]MDR9442497.1 type IX secretion system protein PorQ [Schleiferiaceae bacterium]
MVKHAFYLFLVLLPGLLVGQIGGRDTYRFLSNTAAARVAAQGSNPIANPEEDLNFALSNPSLIRPELHGKLAINGVDYVSDILYGNLAYAHHFDSAGTFLFQTTFMDYGLFERANVIGIRQGTFNVADYAFAVGYGYALDSNWRVGAKLTYISSAYETYQSNGMALDLGIHYYLPDKRFMVALTARNLGLQFTPYANTRESLPLDLQLGVSHRFEHLPLRMQLTLVDLQRWDLRYDNPTERQLNQFTGQVQEDEVPWANNILRHAIVGLEFAPSDGFNVQFGYNFRRRQEMNLVTRRTGAGISFGFGFRLYKFRLNYSRNSYHVAGAANHISITTDFQSFGGS